MDRCLRQLPYGQMADISALASYGWYDWVKYWDLKASFPEPKEAYGKWLGQ